MTAGRLKNLLGNEEVNLSEDVDDDTPKVPEISGETKNFTENIKNTPQKMANQVTKGDTPEQSAENILGDIYKLMEQDREDLLTQRGRAVSKLKDQEEKEELWHGELIKALRYRKNVSEGNISEESETTAQKSKQLKPSEKGSKSFRSSTSSRRPNVPKSSGSTASRAGSSGFSGLSFASIGLGAGLTGIALGSASSIIAREEGLPSNNKAMWDPPNQRNLVSIGYGHQIQAQEYKQGFIQAGNEQIPIKGNHGIDTTMTPEQAKKLLEIDLPKYVQKAKQPLGESWNKLNDNQKAALTSYAYNTGSTESLVRAGLKTAIDNNDMNTAAAIIRDRGIRTAGGQLNSTLIARRAREAAIFQTASSQSNKTKNVPQTFSVPSVPSSSSVSAISNTNKDLKESLQNNNQTTIINNSITPQAQGTKAVVPMPIEDDSPSYLRKAAYG